MQVFSDNVKTNLNMDESRKVAKLANIRKLTITFIDQRVEGEHGHQEREFMGHSSPRSLFCVDYESGC